MAEFVFLDGVQQKKFPPRSLFFGEGLFETFRWKGQPPVFLGKHLERMREGARTLDIPFPNTREIKGELADVIAKSKINDAYVKLCLLSRGSLTFHDSPSESSVLIAIKNYQMPKTSMKVCLAPFKRNSSSPIHRIKSLSYLENVLARREAVRKGFDEAIFLNERGELTEGSATNLFILKGDTLLTPSLDCGLLPGVTRGVLLELAPEVGLKVQETRLKLEGLISSDGTFLTNALIGIVSVGEVDGTKIELGQEIFLRLRNALFKRLNWL
jgi:4-amino-4-deoxychorismate lyase